MEILHPEMDIIDQCWLAPRQQRGSLGLMALPPLAPARTRLLSPQVTGAHYFFLRLTPPRNSRLVLAFGGRETCNQDYVVRRSGYAYHVLEYVAEGAGRVRLDGRESELRAGSVFGYRPDTDFEVRSDPARPMVKYFLCFAGREVPARFARAGVAPGRVRLLAAHAEVRSLLEDLIREGRHHGARTARICEALAEVLLLKLADLAARPVRPGRAEELFLRCRAAMDARLEQPATLKEVAAAVGIQPASVCRLFRRFLGISPYQYLLRRKMILAAELLVESGRRVKETAELVGFADPYHFSRRFKAVHGTPPSRLRAYRRSG